MREASQGMEFMHIDEQIWEPEKWSPGQKLSEDHTFSGFFQIYEINNLPPTSSPKFPTIIVAT